MCPLKWSLWDFKESGFAANPGASWALLICVDTELVAVAASVLGKGIVRIVDVLHAIMVAILASACKLLEAAMADKIAKDFFFGADRTFHVRQIQEG